MKIVVQNLYKRSHLATDLINEYDPDLLLAQEISLYTEDQSVQSDEHTVCNVYSIVGYGTAIYSKQSNALINVRRVTSPYAEIGGFIHKLTTIATYQCNNNNTLIEFISFHGYNGQPFKNVIKLLQHVRDVVLTLNKDSIPAIFAGDFNTWNQEHIDTITLELTQYGFVLKKSWPYPSSRKRYTLDHLFVRNVGEIQNLEIFSNTSDHDGIVFNISI